MEQNEPSSEKNDSELPQWAQGYPNFWEDPALLAQANGDSEYLNLLARRETARLRAQDQGWQADKEALDYYLHKANAVKAYEEAHGLTSSDDPRP